MASILSVPAVRCTDCWLIFAAAVGDTSMQDLASFTAGKLELCMAPDSSHCRLQWSSGYAPTAGCCPVQVDLVAMDWYTSLL